MLISLPINAIEIKKYNVYLDRATHPASIDELTEEEMDLVTRESDFVSTSCFDYQIARDFALDVLEPKELFALQELVSGVLDSLTTDGEDDPETAAYIFWRNLHLKLRKTP